MHLILYRGLAGGVIALVVALWFYAPAPHSMQLLMVTVAIAFLVLLVIQWFLAYSLISGKTKWAFQFLCDSLLAGGLIFSTGGIESPFSLIFGWIIIASGTLAHRLLPIATTVLVCSCYIFAVYGETWHSSNSLLGTQQALHMLLQVSAWILVGGVMAYIAKRHAALRASSEQIIQQHRRLQDLHLKVLHTMREGVIVLDENLEVSDMNEAANKILGTNVRNVLNAVTALKEFLYNPGSRTFQCEYKHGELALLVAATRLSEGHEAAWLLTLVDISEIRKLEQRLVQQEKMAVLGQMTAQLAHEIRNPIQTMTQGLELMTQDGAKGERVQLQAILHDEMLRLNRLVSTMLDYSRPLNPVKVSVSMAELMNSAVNQLNFELQGDVRWHYGERMMNVDVNHFRVLTDNLLSNAFNNRLPDTAVEMHLDADDKSWLLRICNSGGISEVVKKKMFEPFVSDSAHGIGLGLATVKQVCAANGWQVDVNSDAGQVCFTVTGPLISGIQDIELVQEQQDIMRQANG
jgi:two-component system sensor histidine kinase PilS (NtrC family)